MSLNSTTQPIISSIDIKTESPITSVLVVSERTAISAYVHAEEAEPVLYTVASNATVKYAEIVIDRSDPRQITINTY